MSALERVGLRLNMGRHLLRAVSLPRPREVPEGRGLTRAELAGRLTEISGYGPTAALTLACSLVLDAQMEGETVAWITTRESSFYPPDLAEAGVDLDALAVVRCPDGRSVARAADRLARSGAFGLLILDLGAQGEVPLPLQTRLAGLARTHDIALVFLTEKPEDAPSVGSLVSLRLGADRLSGAQGRFLWRAQAIKDKRRGPGWSREAACHGPPGLC